MRSRHWISTVDTHTEGEPTRIVTAGIGHLPGATMVDRRRYLVDHYDHLRMALLSEPRGHKDMYGCVLTPPCNPKADYGVLYMHNSGYMDMCGHATIGVSTALVELGMVQPDEPTTCITLDTPAGLVVARVTVQGGRATNVSFENVPAFAYHLAASLAVPGLGELEVDVAFGGNNFVFFNADALGIDLCRSNARVIVDAGMNVMKAANEQFSLAHPVTREHESINIATLLAAPRDPESNVRNVHVFGPRQFDRSPGGTGTSARLAILHAKRQITLNEMIQIESGMTAGTFRGRILATTQVGQSDAVITEVTGRAHITGFHQFIIDPDDPLPNGFLIDDV